MSMCVLASTLNMQRALLFSIKPMPPISAANWNTTSAPCAAFRQLSLSLRSRTWLSTPGEDWYHSDFGLTSTARITCAPLSSRLLTRCPPMKPPAPHTTTLAFFNFMYWAPNAICQSALGFKMLKVHRWQRLVSHIHTLVLDFGTSSVTIVAPLLAKGIICFALQLLEEGLEQSNSWTGQHLCCLQVKPAGQICQTRAQSGGRTGKCRISRVPADLCRHPQ